MLGGELRQRNLEILDAITRENRYLEVQEDFIRLLRDVEARARRSSLDKITSNCCISR